MLESEFYNGFVFHLFQYEHYSSTDWVKESGCRQHYLAHMISGTAKICVRDKMLQLSPGDIFYIPKGLKYRSHWYPEGNTPVRFYSFGFDHFHSPGDISYPLQKISCAPEALSYMAELEADLTVSLLSIGRLYRFLGAVYGGMQQKNHHGSSQLIHKAMDYMNHTDIFSITDVANHCGISESGLYALFRRELQQTPNQVKQQILAEKATLLLRTTDLSIEQISRQLNFSSSSYFRKILHAQTGKTPSQIRKSRRQI